MTVPILNLIINSMTETLNSVKCQFKYATVFLNILFLFDSFFRTHQIKKLKEKIRLFYDMQGKLQCLRGLQSGAM